ncbi:hypothetical protein PFY12_14595 [Chryseobacterium camelliae]|uniref:Uncharacterized protein n=1 Tax=Chryseobacterium camelliae TaxID=1265445 RepID=A0ABY7QM62_9FLAO|nr:hypothetical protein [Chryseobacterium camelliae]WBV60254.1 hypothetical protein PFY12_14595 [Chryseobacterium camelliae]
MKQFKIEAQASLILEVVKALKYNSSGMGLREIYDIRIERPSYNNNRIIFTAKEGKEINPRDFFYLGLDIVI